MIEIVKSAAGYHLRNGGALVFGPASMGECRNEANRRGKAIAPGVVELAPEAEPAPEPEPEAAPTTKKRTRKAG